MMTTARERADKAAKRHYFPAERDWHIAQGAASAASDVWEPLLRDLVDGWDSADLMSDEWQDAIQRAREALGDE